MTTEKSILTGMLIGDAGISKREYFHAGSRNGNTYFYFGHGIKQSEYAAWKASLLEQFGYSFHRYEQKSPAAVRYNTPRLRRFTELRDVWYPNDKKFIPKDWISEMDEVGLAIWFMDDGNIQLTGNRKSYTARFNSQGYTYQEQEWLQTYLMERFGVEVRIGNQMQKGGLHHRLCCTVKSTQVLFDHIRPIVEQIPCMAYKVQGQELLDKKPAS